MDSIVFNTTVPVGTHGRTERHEGVAGSLHEPTLGYSILVISEPYGIAHVPRSLRGAHLFCDVAIASLTGFAQELISLVETKGASVSSLLSERKAKVASRLATMLVDSWYRAVDRELSVEPVTSSELSLMGMDEFSFPSREELATKLYGASFTAMIALYDSVVAIQMGEGICAVVLDDGSVLLPLESPEADSTLVPVAPSGADAYVSGQKPVRHAIINGVVDGMRSCFVAGAGFAQSLGGYRRALATLASLQVENEPDATELAQELSDELLELGNGAPVAGMLREALFANPAGADNAQVGNGKAVDASQLPTIEGMDAVQLPEIEPVDASDETIQVEAIPVVEDAPDVLDSDAYIEPYAQSDPDEEDQGMDAEFHEDVEGLDEVGAALDEIEEYPEGDVLDDVDRSESSPEDDTLVEDELDLGVSSDDVVDTMPPIDDDEAMDGGAAVGNYSRGERYASYDIPDDLDVMSESDEGMHYARMAQRRSEASAPRRMMAVPIVLLAAALGGFLVLGPLRDIVSPPQEEAQQTVSQPAEEAPEGEDEAGAEEQQQEEADDTAQQPVATVSDDPEAPSVHIAAEKSLNDIANSLRTDPNGTDVSQFQYNYGMDPATILGTVFSRCEPTVLVTDVSGNEALAQVSMTMVDANKVFDKVSGAYERDSSWSWNDRMKHLVDSFYNELRISTDMFTSTTYTLRLTKGDNGWAVASTGTLQDLATEMREKSGIANLYERSRSVVDNAAEVTNEEAQQGEGQDQGQQDWGQDQGWNDQQYW